MISDIHRIVMLCSKIAGRAVPEAFEIKIMPGHLRLAGMQS